MIPDLLDTAHRPREAALRPHQAALRPHQAALRPHEAAPRPHEVAPRLHERALWRQEEAPRQHEGASQPRVATALERSKGAAARSVADPFAPATLRAFERLVARHLVAQGLPRSWVRTACAALTAPLHAHGGAGMPDARAALQQHGLAAAWNALLDRRRAPVLAGLLAPHVRGSVLDLLCGDGAVGRALATQHGVPVALAERPAAYHGATRATADIVAYGAVAACDDGHFDTVLLCTVLHHEARPLATLRLACRLARRRVVIVENPLTRQCGEGLHQLVDLFFNACLNDTGLASPGSHRSRRAWEAAARRHGRAASAPVTVAVPGIPVPHALVVVDVAPQVTAREAA